MLREQDKHFLWSLYSAAAVIFAWKGIWEGIYEIPFIGELSCPPVLDACTPLVFLFLGLAMLTFSGVIFNEFDPLGGLEKGVAKVLHGITAHPEKEKFQLVYFDKERKKQLTITAKRIMKVERGAIIVQHDTRKQELFIPFHRVREVLYKGERYWKF